MLAAGVGIWLAGTASAGIFPFFCTSNSQCDDGLFCTFDLCLITACVHLPECVSNGCNVVACSEESDLCLSDPGPFNGEPCDDGVFCNGADTCQDGECAEHAGDPCPVADDDADCHEAC